MKSDLILKDLNTISATSSRLTKIRYLKSMHSIYGDDFLEVLKLVYNPFIRFNIIKGLAKGQGMDSMTKQDLWYLNSGPERAMVNARLRQLTPKSAELYSRIIRKDLRMGVGVKTINSIWPGLIPTHDVMLAKAIEWHRVKYPCWSTVKLDGVRAIYRDGKFYFRNGKTITGLDHLTEQLKGRPVLDGELMCPDLNFQQSSGQIRSYDASPTAEFHIIDLPELDAANFKLRMLVAHSQVRDATHARVVRHHLTHNERHLREEYAIAVSEGYEGVVVKPEEYQYVGKRSYNWMKIKEIKTEDLYVTDIFEGSGKYTDKLGGVIVDRDGVDVRVGSGFSDAHRSVLWDHPYDIIGRCIEVQYHEVTPGGSLRHPRFIRFRDDKAMESSR